MSGICQATVGLQFILLGSPLGLSTMDANLQKVLDELPEKPPRSRLEPYREFIEQLRSRGRTYRDIADILAEKCAVKVTGSGVHDFVRTRSRTKTRQAENGPTKPNQHPAPASSREEIQRKIAMLKARKTSDEPGVRAFDYDPEQPLTLQRSRRE